MIILNNLCANQNHNFDYIFFFFFNKKESREGRVNSWKDFKTKTKVQTSTFKMPKHKPETR